MFGGQKEEEFSTSRIVNPHELLELSIEALPSGDTQNRPVGDT